MSNTLFLIKKKETATLEKRVSITTLLIVINFLTVLQKLSLNKQSLVENYVFHLN